MLAQTTDYVSELFRELGVSESWAFPLEILLIVVAATVVARVGSRLIRRSVHGVVARSARVTDASAALSSRAETLAGVAASLVRVVVWTLAVLLVLGTLGINLGPLLAGASIVGVAVGFGAQSLVRDFLSGFFVLAEDQYGVGDTVTVSDLTGTVEEVNLRVTRLRAPDGTVWFVPNGEIRKVGNATKEWGVAIVDVTVPAGAAVDVATTAIAEEAAALRDDPAWSDAVLAPAEVLGVESLAADGFTIRVSVKTMPGQRARVGRALRARIGARLRRDGIVPWREPAASPE